MNYLVRLGINKLIRNPIVSIAVAFALSIGVGACVTMLQVTKALHQDPIPGVSEFLYTPHIDPLPIEFTQGDGPDPSKNLTWVDTQALLRARPDLEQAAMAGASVYLDRQGGVQRPRFVDGRLATPGIFNLFKVKFLRGRGWTREEEAASARVVVISKSLAQEVFGNEEALGKSLSLDGKGFTVVGVIDAFHPHPLFYADASAKKYSDEDSYYLPLETGLENEVQVTSNVTGWGEKQGDDLKSPGATWLQFWVRLTSEKDIEAYRSLLWNYAQQQKEMGRFERSADSSKLISLSDWMRLELLVPRDIKFLVALAFGFLVACIVSATALLTTEFFRYEYELSIRRALGATRRSVFGQLLVQAGIIGVSGGVIGSFLAWAGIALFRARPDDYAQLIQLDWKAIIFAALAGILSALLSALLPAYIVGKTEPARMIKVSQ